MVCATQLRVKRLKMWLLVATASQVVACLNTTASCVERDFPDNACYSWPNVSTEGCSKVPGCSIRDMCVAITCHSGSVQDAGVVAKTSGDSGICVLSDHVACAQLPLEQCSLNLKCTVSTDCGGVPTVNCASIKNDVQCMAYPVCFWQISGT